MPRIIADGLVSMVVAILLGAAPAAQAPSGRQSAATITGAFADACRDFTVHSSKDISYIELHYVAGLVVRHESINNHDHAIDGGAGDEIAFAAVKSGTTIEEFACVRTNRAPTALLEIQTPPIDQTLAGCYPFWDGGWTCESSTPRTAWTSSSQVPNTGGGDSGLFHWVCGDPFPCLRSDDLRVLWPAVTFRGIRSSDPDGDIASWSLDFGDGTFVSGTWSAPPIDLAHTYTGGNCVGVFGPNICVVTLTVTDSAGQSHSDTIPIVFLDLSPA